MRNCIRDHTLIAFFFFAFLFSWTVEFLLIASKFGWLNISLPFSLHYLASFGPLISAFLVTWISGGRAGVKELWSRITKWRVDKKWIFFAVLSPSVFYLMGIVVNFLFTRQ